jgi:hypothetical protein
MCATGNTFTKHYSSEEGGGWSGARKSGLRYAFIGWYAVNSGQEDSQQHQHQQQQQQQQQQQHGYFRIAHSPLLEARGCSLREGFRSLSLLDSRLTTRDSRSPSRRAGLDGAAFSDVVEDSWRLTAFTGEALGLGAGGAALSTAKGNERQESLRDNAVRSVHYTCKRPTNTHVRARTCDCRGTASHSKASSGCTLHTLARV